MIYSSPRARAFLVLIALLFLAGCDNLTNQKFPPLVLDDAKLLSPEARKWIESFPFPQGYALAVRTVDRLPESLIGAQADDLFSQTAEESKEKKALTKRGVFVLVCAEPPLVQIRVGTELYGAARWGGVTAGPEYIEKQTLARPENAEDSLRSIVPWLAESLPHAMDLPAFKRVVLQQAQDILGDEIEELGLPSENFYGHYILKPILRLRVIELGALRSWWITYVLVALAIYLLRRLLELTLGAWHRALTRDSKPSRHVVAGIKIIASIGIGIFLSIPAAASTILLTGSRLEDQIALRASGIPGVERLSFDPSTYRINTGLAIALLILSLRLLNGFGSRSHILRPARLPAATQSQLFQKLEEENPAYAFLLRVTGMRSGKTFEISDEDFSAEPFTSAYFMPGIDDLKAAIAWSALAFLFLPRPVSLAAVFLWTLPALKGAFDTFKALYLTGNDDGAAPPFRRIAQRPLRAVALALLTAGSVVVVYRQAQRQEEAPARETESPASASRPATASSDPTSAARPASVTGSFLEPITDQRIANNLTRQIRRTSTDSNPIVVVSLEGERAWINLKGTNVDLPLAVLEGDSSNTKVGNRFYRKFTKDDLSLLIQYEVLSGFAIQEMGCERTEYRLSIELSGSHIKERIEPESYGEGC